MRILGGSGTGKGRGGLPLILGQAKVDDALVMEVLGEGSDG